MRLSRVISPRLFTLNLGSLIYFTVKSLNDVLESFILRIPQMMVDHRMVGSRTTKELTEMFVYWDALCILGGRD